MFIQPHPAPPGGKQKSATSDKDRCVKLGLSPPRSSPPVQPEVWVCEAPLSSPISRLRASKLSVRSGVYGTISRQRIPSIPPPWALCALSGKPPACLKILGRRQLPPAPRRPGTPRSGRPESRISNRPWRADLRAGPLLPLHVRPCAANRESVPRNPLPWRVRHVGQRQGALGGERSLPIGQLIQTIPCHLGLGQIAGLQPPVQIWVTSANLCFADAV